MDQSFSVQNQSALFTDSQQSSTNEASTQQQSQQQKTRIEEDGCRLVSGVVAIHQGKILLVSSRRHQNEWILPKGGIEKNESIIQAALREAFEEGGVSGHIVGNGDSVVMPSSQSTTNITPLVSSKNNLYQIQNQDKNGQSNYQSDEDYLPLSRSGSDISSSASSITSSVNGDKHITPLVNRKVQSRNQQKRWSWFVYYEMYVSIIHDQWPESDVRIRKWCTFEEAIELCKRQEMVDAIKQCSLSKQNKDSTIQSLEVVQK